MFGIDKRITSSWFRSSSLVAVSIAALFAFGSAAHAAIPSLAPPASAPAMDGDHFGVALTVPELAGASGNGGWLFTAAQTNALVALFEAVASSQAGADGAAAGKMLALNGPLQPAMLTVTTAPAGGDLLKTQSAALSFDSSVRYLCSDKIYADLYPNGKGWNNHAYSECQPGGAFDPDRSHAAPLISSTHASEPPGGGPGYVNLPCGGSFANVQSMTIGAGTAGSGMVNVGSAIASLSSLTSLGRGHHQ